MKIFMWAALFFCAIATGLSVTAAIWFFFENQPDLAALWTFCTAISAAMGLFNAVMIDKHYKD